MLKTAPIPAKTRARALEHEVTHIADIRFLAERGAWEPFILPIVCSPTEGVRGKVKREQGSSRTVAAGGNEGFSGRQLLPCAVEPFGRFRVLEPYEWDDMVPAYISLGRIC